MILVVHKINHPKAPGELTPQSPYFSDTLQSLAPLSESSRSTPGYALHHLFAV